MTKNNKNKDRITYISSIAIGVGVAALCSQSIYKSGYDHGVADTSLKMISCILKYH